MLIWNCFNMKSFKIIEIEVMTKFVQQILFSYVIFVALLIYLSRFEKLLRKQNYLVVNPFTDKEHPHVYVCRLQRMCHQSWWYNSNRRTFNSPGHSLAISERVKSKSNLYRKVKEPSQTGQWSRRKPNWNGWRNKQKNRKLGKNRGILKPS